MQKSTSSGFNPKSVERRESRSSCRKKWRGKLRAASEHSSRCSVLHSKCSNSSELWTINNSSLSLDSEQNLAGTPAYDEFLKNVICPFCQKIQEDKINMIKHLEDKCRFITKRGLPFTTFQILPTNSIKCNLCPFVILTSIKNYFFHAIHNHQEQTDNVKFLFCSCCQILVPANHTQLEYHLRHKIHNTRRKSIIDPNYFLNKGTHCIYCFYNGKKKFKCLSCPPPDFLFSNPFAAIHHFKTAKHNKNLKKSFLIDTIHCCFCSEEVTEQEAPYHFTSINHLDHEKGVIGEGSYELCFYCGYASRSLKDMSTHMRSYCEEIRKIRQEMGQKSAPCKKAAETDKINSSEHKIREERCILVEDNVDIIELVKTLKNYGKIVYVGTYGNSKTVIEFKRQETIEFVLLMRSFIKVNGKKVNIQFLGGAEGGAQGKKYLTK